MNNGNSILKNIVDKIFQPFFTPIKAGNLPAAKPGKENEEVNLPSLYRLNKAKLI